MGGCVRSVLSTSIYLLEDFLRDFHVLCGLLCVRGLGGGAWALIGTR